MKPHIENDQDEILGKAYDGRLVRRLVPYIKPYGLPLFFSVLLLAGTTILDLAGPFLTKIAIDRDIVPHKPDGLKLIVLLYFGALLGSFVMKYAMNYLMQYVGQRVMYDMRAALFGHLQRVPLRFFDKHPVGSLMTRMT